MLETAVSLWNQVLHAMNRARRALFQLVLRSLLLTFNLGSLNNVKNNHRKLHAQHVRTFEIDNTDQACSSKCRVRVRVLVERTCLE
jgi:hypothetical protein